MECSFVFFLCFRGTISSRSSAVSVQTLSLGCSRGRIVWEFPKGGLQVRLSPNLRAPYKLCLEDEEGGRRASAHRILLEESPGHLLHILSTRGKNSDCYRISGPSAVLYIESHGLLKRKMKGGLKSGSVESSSPISIAYEVEPLRGESFNSFYSENGDVLPRHLLLPPLPLHLSLSSLKLGPQDSRP